MPPQSQQTSNFVAPGQMRQLRACMFCSVVQTTARFSREGCPNCPFLALKGSAEGIEDCTSQVFEGVITLANPADSWVAKWQRLEAFVPGVYAVKVNGLLPEEMVDQIEASGTIKYIP
ncbi:MAG: transcription elongation factor spt4 [Trizodia sp. TS-e1964]|nr:MAG: transcription elongation factor spt4 [Trizodia sp. TS-e1964]